MESAGIKFPPPLYYAAGLGLGLAASAYVPTPWPISHVVRMSTGWLLVIASGTLAFWSLGLFWSKKTSVLPHRPSTSLVITGPYRFTRNPMYTAMAILHAGVAILFESLWALLLLPAVLALVRWRVIAREEAYLEGRFGQDYRDYCGRVRRWI